MTNKPLVRPSLRWLIELHLEGSFPLYLTNDPLTTARLGAGPELVSTVDVAPSIAPPGLGWQEEIASENPIIWFKLSEVVNTVSVVNSGSAGGVAVLVVATDEVEVRSPVLASPDGKLYDKIYTTATCGVDVGSGAYLRTITLAIQGKGAQFVRTLVSSHAANESVAIPFNVAPGELLIATFHSTDGNNPISITDGGNTWLPIPGLATMDVWYSLMGNGLTAGNFITVLWQFTPSISSQLLIDQFTGGEDWLKPDRIVQSSASAEIASTGAGVFTGGAVTPATYPSLIYFSLGTNAATIPAAGGWSNGMIATSVVAAGGGFGPAKCGGAYRMMQKPSIYQQGVRRITTTAVSATTGFTMMCWMKCESVGVYRFICRANYSGRYASIIVTELGLLKFAFSVVDELPTTVFIADGFWHFVVAVIDRPVPADLRASLYVDGVSVGTKVWPSSTLVTPANVEFGPSEVALDELVITPAPLDSGRVMELYLAGLREGAMRPQVETPLAAIAADHPRAWYRMNDGPDAKGFGDSRGLVPADDWITKVSTMTPTMWYRLGEEFGATDYYNSGSLAGVDLAVISGTSTVINGALLFDSNTARLFAGTGEMSQKSAITGRTYPEKLTIAFWVDISSMTTPVATASILQIADAAKHVSIIWPTASALQLGIRVIDGTHTGSITNVSIEADNHWHLLAFTMERLPATSQVLLTTYYDGVQFAQNTYAYTTWATGATNITLSPDKSIKLDELLIWDGQVVDAAAIRALFVAGMGPGRPLLPSIAGPVGGAQVAGALVGDTDPAHRVEGAFFQSPPDTSITAGEWVHHLRDGYTIETWVRRSTAPVLVQISAQHPIDPYPVLEFAATGVRGVFGAVGNAPVNVYDGEWHHVAMCFRPVGTQAKLELFVDGVLRDSDLVSGVGIDAEAWYSYTISLGSGGSAYAAAVTADAPKLWWRLNEASGATSFVNSGSIAGNALGKAGSGGIQTTSAVLDTGSFARQFTGAFAAEQLLGGITGAAIFTASTSVTMTAWMKPGTVTTGGIMFELITATAPKTAISLKWNTSISGRSVEVTFQDNTNPARSDVYGLGGVAGDWHFVAVTYVLSGTGLITISTYVDGVFSGSRVYVAAAPFQAFTVATITGGQNSVVDEFAYYEKALSSARIEAQYKAGLGRSIELDEVAFFSPVLSAQRIAAHARAGRWITNRLYTSRVREGATLQFASPTETGGIVAAAQISIGLPNTDGYWNQWYGKEVRGKLVHAHLLDENTQEIQEFLFTGEISVWNYARGSVEVLCESIAAQKLSSAVPGLFLPPMTTEGDPLTNSGTTGEPARAVASGMGAAVSLPGMLAKQQGANNLDPPEWDYVLGRGNLGISGISVNGTRSDDRTIWVYKARLYQPGGIYCTALRFGGKLYEGNTWDGGNIVVADVQRSYPDWDDFALYEWKWLLDPFLDDVHEVSVATPSGYVSPLTTGALTTGPTGLGLGGVNLTAKDGDFLESSASVSIPYDPFTVELWLKPKATGHMGTKPALLTCPRATSATTAWRIMYDVATKKVQWEEIETSIMSVVASVVVPDDVWSQVVFARARLPDGSILLKVYLNGKLVSINPSPPLVYSTTPFGYRFFDYPGNARAHRFSGVFGWCRISTCERDARYVQKAYWFMRRNFIELLREMLEIDMGDFVNDQSFIAAAQIVNDIPSPDAGLLCCDGWMTQPVDVRTAIVALSRMRDFRLMRDRTGAISIEMVQPGVVRQMTLAAGPPDNNIVSVDRLVKFSLSEAISGMPMMYRQARDAGGQLTGYNGRAWAEVLPVGRTGEVFELPFVFSHRTADIIRDFIAKRLRLRDGAISLTADHSARFLRPGHVVKLSLPTLVGYDQDAELVSSSMQGYQNALTVVGYDETPFVYVPNPDLPKDTTPFEIALPATKPRLRAVDAQGRDWAARQGTIRSVPFFVWVHPDESFLWDVLIGDVEATLPINYVANAGAWTVTGTASQVEALTTAGDSKYITSTNAAAFRAGTADPVKVVPDVAAVVWEVTWSYTVAGGQAYPVPLSGAPNILPTNIYMQAALATTPNASGITVGQQTFFPGTGAFGPVTVSGLMSFIPTNVAGAYTQMDYATARVVKVGMRGALASGGIRVDKIVKYIYPKIDKHNYFGFVRLWRSQTQAIPAADTTPYKTLPQLYGIADGGPDDPWPANGMWFYYVRVYDILSREIGAFGPLPVLVDPAKVIDVQSDEPTPP